MSEWWRQFLDAFLSRGVYDPSGRDQKIARLREGARSDREYIRRSLLVYRDEEDPDVKGTVTEQALKFSVALIRLHHFVYGTWPSAADVQRALDAVHVPNNGPLAEDRDESP